MKAFLLLLAAFLSTTVTLTNAAAFPRDAVSRLPLSIHGLRGPNMGDGGLQGVALEGRAGEEGNELKPGPSNAGTKRRLSHSHIPSPPTSAPDSLSAHIEDFHRKILLIVEEERKEGKLSQALADRYTTTVTKDTTNVMAAEGTKKTGDSKGSEGGGSGKASPTSSNSSFGSSSSCDCSGSETSEGGSSRGEDVTRSSPLLDLTLSHIDDINKKVYDGLVEKGGVPDDLLKGLEVASCIIKEQVILWMKQKEEKMEPAEKRRKIDDKKHIS
ncbi:hypothetical protein H0H93_004057 [Arthromyces matolae]|nr:hypothetical protein H0H93_004057 [Arthromyces matolae]